MKHIILRLWAELSSFIYMNFSKVTFVKIATDFMIKVFGTTNFYRIFIILWANLWFWSGYYLLKLYLTVVIITYWVLGYRAVALRKDNVFIRFLCDMGDADGVIYPICRETILAAVLFIFIHLVLAFIAWLINNLIKNSRRRQGLTPKSPSLKSKCTLNNHHKSFHTSTISENKTTRRENFLSKTDLPKLPFNNNITVDNSDGSYKNTFKCINVIKNRITKNKPFHKANFAVYDLETMMHNGKLVPYLLGWTVVLYNPRTGVRTITSKFELLPLKATDEMIQKALITMFKDISRRLEKTRTKEMILLAHNGGRFDVKVILNPILQLVEAKVLKINHTISSPTHEVFELSITFLERNIKFLIRDSYKIISSPVANISKMFLGTVSKMRVNHNLLNKALLESKDLNTWTPDLIEATLGANTSYNSPAEYLAKYCMIDCEVVANALIKFSIAIHANMNTIISAKSMITISSTAIELFLQKFYDQRKSPIIEIPLTTAISSWLKKAYIGGRTEVFHSAINLQKIYHFDVPGMYARCMQLPLPTGNPVYVSDFNRNMDMREIIRILKANNMIGFFECRVIAPDNLHLPVLPIKHNGKLTFPLGSFKGIWTTYELELAVEKGYKITPHYGYIFIAQNPLKEYSITLSNMKEEAGVKGDAVMRNTAKLLLNTLYGKFARTYYGTSTMIVSRDELRDLERMYDLVAVTETDSNMVIVTYNTKPLKSADNKFPKDMINEAFKKHNRATTDKTTNIAIAATITSHGRVMLYKLYEEVIARGGIVCYSDTDSIFAQLPESPFNKPFGPFIWDGVPEDNTYSKAIFIAPKMYFLERESGKVTFKVKGSSTKSSLYTYEDLMKCFLDNTPIVFKDQLAFKNIMKRGKFEGLKMFEDLTKTYKIFASLKREWIQDNNTFTTNPIIIDKNITDNRTEMVTKWDLNKFEDLKVETKNLVVKKVEEDVYTFNNIRAHIMTRNNIYITTLNNINPNKDEFKELWTYLMRAAAANTEKFDKLELLERLVITAYDEKRRINKTIGIMRGTSWMSMKPEDAAIAIKELVDKSIMEYGEEFMPTKITFKLYFKINPQLVENTNMERIYNTTFLKIVDHTAEREKLLKLMKDAQDQLNSLNNMSTEDIEAFKNFEKELKQKYPAVQDFLKTVEKVILEVTENNKSIFNSNTAKFLRRAFYKTMIENCNWSIHSYHERIIDHFKLDRTSPEDIKIALNIAWEILITLYHKGVLGMTSMKVGDDKSLRFKKMHVFLAKSSEVNAWMMLKHLSRGISFSPIKVLEGPHISKDMVNTINKLNSTPIKLNKEYLTWLIMQLSPIISDKRIQEKLGWTTPEQKERIVIAYKTRVGLLTILNELMTKVGANHFYIRWMHDFRGRLYPKLTNISHMSHKFMRPLFILNTDPIIATSLNDTLIGKDMILVNKNYIKVLELSFGFKIQDISPRRLVQPIEMMKSFIDPKNKEEFDFSLINRILEFSTLIQKGSVVPAPLQIDSTCNVIQHIASITGNTEIMKTIGLLTDTSITKDFYTTIADKMLNLLKEEMLMELDRRITVLQAKLSRVLATLNVKELRELVKKPTMTKAYAAKFITSMDYLNDALLKNDIQLDNRVLKLLTDVLMTVLNETLAQEITLIEIIQKLVKNATKTISWNILPLSDFTILMENMKSYKMDTKLYTKVNGRELEIHTTYKVRTNTPNTIKNINSIFVNVIHSLDALHIGLILKNSGDALPIHDALLLPMNTNLDRVMINIHSTFLRIHGNNTMYKRIRHQLSVTLGDRSLWDYVITLKREVFNFNDRMWTLAA